MKKIILILIFVLFIVVVPAYQQTYRLCYDENGKGIECYGLFFIDERAIWNRTLNPLELWSGFYSVEQIEYLFNEGKGRGIFIDLCYINGFGEKCFQFF